MRLEHSISFGNYTMEALRAIAQPSTFSCPDCGGVLFELHDRKPMRYRCHTGHAFSLLSLLATLEEKTDVALWAAVRALREKEGLLRRLAEMDSETDPAPVAGIA